MGIMCSFAIGKQIRIIKRISSDTYRSSRSVYMGFPLCFRCLNVFSSSERLQQHTVDCLRLNGCAVELPSEEETILRFQHHERKERVPFVIYADFECLLEELEQPSMDRRTYEYQRHKAHSVGYYVHCSDDPVLCRYRAYRSDTDCVQWFVRELREFANVAYSWLLVKKTNDIVNAATVAEFSRCERMPRVRRIL